MANSDSFQDGHWAKKHLRPLPPLVEASGDVGFTMVFREGERAVVRDRRRFYPAALFSSAIAGSYALRGQPIRVSGFERGVSMRACIKRFPAGLVDPDEFIPQLWSQLAPHYERWLAELTASPCLQLCFEAVGLEVQFARDHLEELKPGVMQIDVED